MFDGRDGRITGKKLSVSRGEGAIAGKRTRGEEERGKKNASGMKSHSCC